MQDIRSKIKNEEMDAESGRKYVAKIMKEIKRNDYAIGVVISRIAYTMFYEELYKSIVQ